MKITPYAHQLVGIDKLVEHPYFALFDEMGLGKTLQVIWAACELYRRGIINRVIVLCPATVRSVWFDPELGELKKHLPEDLSAAITEFHAKTRRWHHGPASKLPFEWVISNYDFIRSKSRISGLKVLCTHQTLLVLDESSAVKNHRSLQTRACLTLRKRCGRVVLLNGTPIENNPGDMYSQGHIMSKDILECTNWYYFRARYAVMGGWMNKQVMSWRDIEDIQVRFAPHVLRRLKSDCLDLPEKLPPVSLTVALDEKTWRQYREMRDEMVTWLSHQRAAVSAQAGVKAMRLAQITAGFVGGLQDVENFDEPTENEPQVLVPGQVAEVGREKLDLLIPWVRDQLAQDPELKLLIWCRFRPEMKRVRANLAENFPDCITSALVGGQKPAERQAALRLLDPRTAPKEAVLTVGTLGSGARGLNLTACHTVVYMSCDFRYGTYVQSMDRVHRPGQIHPVSYFDVIATGPKGQRTIDHIVLKARGQKEDLAAWTTSAWVTALQEDVELDAAFTG